MNDRELLTCSIADSIGMGALADRLADAILACRMTSLCEGEAIQWPVAILPAVGEAPTLIGLSLDAASVSPPNYKALLGGLHYAVCRRADAWGALMLPVALRMAKQFDGSTRADPRCPDIRRPATGNALIVFLPTETRCLLISGHAVDEFEPETFEVVGAAIPRFGKLSIPSAEPIASSVGDCLVGRIAVIRPAAGAPVGEAIQ